MRQEATKQLCSEICRARCCRAPSAIYLDQGEMRRLKALGRIAIHQERRGVWVVIFAAQRDRRCPFLGAEGLCAIYPERPRACRAFPERPDPNCLAWPVEVTA